MIESATRSASMPTGRTRGSPRVPRWRTASCSHGSPSAPGWS